MAKSDLGTKRICPTTGKKFYDLNKNPVISPYTGEVVPIAPIPPPRTRADAAYRPGKLTGPLHPGAQRPHRFGGIEHVLALEQAGNPGFADRQRAEDQGTVRNRLVAGNANFSGQGPAGAGFKR